jgi:hypothetical protein
VVPLTESATFVFTTTVLTALNCTLSMLAVRDDADEVTEGDVGGVALPEDDVDEVELPLQPPTSINVKMRCQGLRIIRRPGMSAHTTTRAIERQRTTIQLISFSPAIRIS